MSPCWFQAPREEGARQEARGTGCRRSAGRIRRRGELEIECFVFLSEGATFAFSPCYHLRVCGACSASIMADTRQCPHVVGPCFGFQGSITFPLSSSPALQLSSNRSYY